MGHSRRPAVQAARRTPLTAKFCPAWPGQPMSAHWGVPDPAAATGTEAELRYAFSESHRMLYARISIFTGLPLSSIGRLALQQRLDEIWKAT